MGDNLARRERESARVGNEASQRLFIVLRADAAAAGSGVGAAEVAEPKDDWATRVPEELVVAAAVLGACIGCPIGAAAGGVVAGFVGGFLGALLGELVVLAVARVLKLVLGLAAVGVVVLVAYAILRSVGW